MRSGRIYLAPNVPFGWIDFPPSINRLIGLRWLAKVLYPELFPEDLRPSVRDFYTLCYHRTPTDAAARRAAGDVGAAGAGRVMRARWALAGAAVALVAFVVVAFAVGRYPGVGRRSRRGSSGRG